ncbi:hypothetical protein F4779DRAFT_604998 [Xylariaceae sp. FL0662B]|nr:hypothetical protein F4779DRAFT_604998 [Xylariaceae sp. FL0662B]
MLAHQHFTFNTKYLINCREAASLSIASRSPTLTAATCRHTKLLVCVMMLGSVFTTRANFGDTRYILIYAVSDRPLALVFVEVLFCGSFIMGHVGLRGRLDVSG